MFPIVDYRNGRYQGQIIDGLPHGLGIFMDKNFLFCIAYWTHGQLNGPTIIIYPSGRIFCGTLKQSQPQNIALFELPQDHVQFYVQFGSHKNRATPRIAAVIPFFKLILEIDSSKIDEECVLQEHQYYRNDKEKNWQTVSRIMNLGLDTQKVLNPQKNWIQFFQDNFLQIYPQIFEFLITSLHGKKEYFMGLQSEGLGIKIQPIEQLQGNAEKMGRVYIVRAMGCFSKQNQLKQLGLKTFDNSMKGLICEEGVYSLPQTLVRYESNKRPQKCSGTCTNYFKRSIYYKDRFVQTSYIYKLGNFIDNFDHFLRKSQTQKIAQYTIQNPSEQKQTLDEIQRKRRQKHKQKQNYLKNNQQSSQSSNIFNPSTLKITNPEFSLDLVKEQIYRSANKKKNPEKMIQYRNIQYKDPNRSDILKKKSTNRTPEKIGMASIQRNKTTTSIGPSSNVNNSETKRTKNRINGLITSNQKKKVVAPEEEKTKDIRQQKKPRQQISIVEFPQKDEIINQKTDFEPVLKDERRIKNQNKSKNKPKVTYKDQVGVIYQTDKKNNENKIDSQQIKGQKYHSEYIYPDSFTNTKRTKPNQIQRLNSELNTPKIKNRKTNNYQLDDSPQIAIKKMLPTPAKIQKGYKNKYLQRISPNKSPKKRLLTENILLS